MKTETDNSVKDQNATCDNNMLQDVTLLKSDFKLVGLGRKKSMTCEPLNNENIFWPKVGLTQDRFDALWNYKKNHWDDKMIAEIEHEGINEEGIPINGIVVAVREL